MKFNSIIDSGEYSYSTNNINNIAKIGLFIIYIY